MNEDNPNMVKYISKLDAGDKGLICAAVRQFSSQFPDAHPGMLPFMPVRLVVTCVSLRANDDTNRHRPYLSVLNKLEAHKWLSAPNSSQTVMLRKLDDGLVAKRLGIHPERGVPIPGIAAVIKRPRDRKMFEKVTDAFDHSHPMMTLKKLADGLWRIDCPKIYQHYVSMWCIDYLT